MRGRPTGPWLNCKRYEMQGKLSASLQRHLLNRARSVICLTLCRVVPGPRLNRPLLITMRNGAFLYTMIACSSSFYSGRRTGRAELEHHFEETRELSKSARWISPGKDRALQQARRSAVAPQRWDRAEPIENRSHNREREKIPQGEKRIRNFRYLSLDLCWRRTNPESLAKVGGLTSAHR